LARVLVNGLLLAILVGLLFTYFAVVSSLPAQIYTTAQQEYLNYNYGRSVAQKAPILNIVQADGQVAAINLPGRQSRVRATLTARYEEQEGVSVTTYDLDFRGEYQLAHSGPSSTTVELFFPFPGNLETLHEVRFVVDGEEPPEAIYSTRGISWQTVLAASEAHEVAISYKADGASQFTYGLPHEQRADVDIVVTVVGLTGSNIPKSSIPATANNVEDNRQIITWHYTGLIADRDIQLTLPARLSFAQRLSQLQDEFQTLAGLAPILVGLCLASIGGVFHLSGLRLRLESYLLMGCGLALFYPTLTFLSGVIDVAPAAVLALLLVTGLLLAFLALLLGWRQVRWRAGLLLFTFLGIFSLGTLTPWRGLLLTGGGLLLIGIFMLLYARRRPVEPEEAPEPAPLPLEAASTPEPGPAPLEDISTPEPVLPPLETGANPVQYHCPYCARTLAEDYSFCPGCGHDTSQVRRCAHCGQEQFVPEELAPAYCLNCGQVLPES
ncbi:MAG: zinc ribbon domain-containing protein, partial [Chloroflexota bacterium]